MAFLFSWIGKRKCMANVIQDTKDMLRDRIFLQKALLIAFPVALQGMLNTIVNLVDTLMIGQLGETTIAAVGLANKVFFVFSLLVFGVVSGSGVLAAQYWGNQDVKNIRKVTGLALLIAALAFVVIRKRNLKKELKELEGGK